MKSTGIEETRLCNLQEERSIKVFLKSLQKHVPDGPSNFPNSIPPKNQFLLVSPSLSNVTQAKIKFLQNFFKFLKSSPSFQHYAKLIFNGKNKLIVILAL